MGRSLVSGIRVSTPAAVSAMFAFGAAAFALAAPAVFQSFPAPNLVAYYALDETAVGTAADASGGGFNGTHVDTPTPNTTDKAPLLFANAASLGLTDAGTTATMGDRVTLPNGVVNGRTDLTAAWWMKTAKTGTQAIVSGANAAGGNEYLLYFVNNTVFRYHDKGTSFDTTIPNIADNAWHHIAAVRDDTTNVVTIYTDGTPRGSNNTLALGTLSVAAGGLVVGEEQDSVGGSFDALQSFVGLLDDLRFYSRVLTAAEVAYLAAGYGPPPAPMLTSATGGMDPVTGQPRVDLVWTAVTTTPATPVTYTVLRGTTATGPYPTTVATGVTGTTYGDTTGSFGTTYYYVVRATNVGGTSGNSNELSATPQPPPPRTNDHTEGLLEDKCGCGTARPASPWLAGLIGILYLWVILSHSGPRRAAR